MEQKSNDFSLIHLKPIWKMKWVQQCSQSCKIIYHYHRSFSIVSENMSHLSFYASLISFSIMFSHHIPFVTNDRISLLSLNNVLLIYVNTTFYLPINLPKDTFTDPMSYLL
jgi:hypothetical protein